MKSVKNVLKKLAVDKLMTYIITLYMLGNILYFISPETLTYTNFDIGLILKGQVWRIFSWLIWYLDDNILFAVISIMFYFFVGRTLEMTLGKYKFNAYIWTGIFFNILAGVLYNFIFDGFTFGGFIDRYLYVAISGQMFHYLNLSLFFAFAYMFGQASVLLFMIIPFKVIYLAYIYGAVIGYDIIKAFTVSWQLGVADLSFALLGLANFGILMLTTKSVTAAFMQRRRASSFKKAYEAGQKENRNASVQFGENGRAKAVITRHKCAVCGRTELDDDELEFRFCSKCDGNYEYCMTHLYTHTHVMRSEPELNNNNNESQGMV